MGRFRVKELAQARGLTAEDLMYKSGLRLSTIRNVWQNRVYDPAFSTLLALSRALEVSIEDLVDPASDGDGQMSTRMDRRDGRGVVRVDGDGTKNRVPEGLAVA